MILVLNFISCICPFLNQHISASNPAMMKAVVVAINPYLFSFDRFYRISFVKTPPPHISIWRGFSLSGLIKPLIGHIMHVFGGL